MMSILLTNPNCLQVHSGRGEVLASRHSVVTVQPVPDIGTSPFQGSSGGGVSQDADSSNSKQNPILGPINEAHVTATRGTDVILECRDSDGEEVYWQKQGNPTIVGYGRQLRLPRVERWDSGLYFCSSNTSAPLSHNYTLQVDQAPTVKAPTVALQVVGEAAILSCEVNNNVVCFVEYTIRHEFEVHHTFPQTRWRRCQYRKWSGIS